MSAPFDRRLSVYMITPMGAPPDSIVDRVDRALQWGVDRIQLRMSRQSGGSIEGALERVLERCPDARERLFVNDRFDLALAGGVSGVHLPARGLPVRRVRAHAPTGFRIGVSTHDASEVTAAGRDGADFVVFGPVFPTASKPGHPGLGVAALRTAVQSAAVPVYALGGITLDRIDDLAETGIAGVAGISMFEDEASARAVIARLP